MSHLDAFEQLKALIGSWCVQHDHGRVSEVNYRMSCNKTVLVETWALKPGVESLTIFHMDRADLIATHYCPLGNQPRLKYVGMNDDKMIFETVSVTNLADASGDHCRAVDFHFISADSVERTETYAEKGVSTTESGIFSRSNGSAKI